MKKNVKEKPKQNRPTTTAAENPFKNLGDFAKDFMDDQRRQMEKQPPVIESAPLPSKKEAKEVQEPKKVTSRPGRLSVHNDPKKEVVRVERDRELIPTSKEELIRAVVFSEILAPPKSRR